MEDLIYGAGNKGNDRKPQNKDPIVNIFGIKYILFLIINCYFEIIKQIAYYIATKLTTRYARKA